MMWGYYSDAWTWLLMAGVMVLFWGGIAVLVVYVVRGVTGPRGGAQALGVLRQRLASGEITQEEFEKTRRVLQG